MEVGLVTELTVMLGKYLDIGGDSENMKKIKLAAGKDVSPAEWQEEPNTWGFQSQFRVITTQLPQK